MLPTIAAMLAGSVLAGGVLLRTLRRRSQEEEDAYERERREAEAARTRVPTAVVTLMLALPSARRGEYTRRAQLHRRSAADLLDALMKDVDGVPVRLSIEPSAEVSRDALRDVALAGAKLDALSGRDRARVEAAYREAPARRSVRGEGTVVLALAVVVRAIEGRAPVRDPSAILQTLDELGSSIRMDATHHELRWIPGDEDHAFEDAALREAFPELTSP